MLFISINLNNTLVLWLQIHDYIKNVNRTLTPSHTYNI